MVAVPAHKGSGTVRKRGDGWEFYRDERAIEGGQVRRGGYAARADAELALVLHRHHADLRKQEIDASLPLSVVGEKWLAAAEVKATTRERYRRDLQVHVLPVLGDRPLGEITTGEVANLFDTLRVSGGRGNWNKDQPLAYSSLCGIYTVVRQIYQWGLVRGLVLGSPVDGIDRRHFVGRGSKGFDLNHPVAIEAMDPLEAFTIDETERFVTALNTWKGQGANRDGHQYREAWLLALLTGLRLGEVLGLGAEHIDANQKVLHVRQQLTVVNHNPVLTGPKSYNSVRDIPVGPGALEVVREQQQRLFRYQQIQQGQWPEHRQLFVQPNGTSPNPERFSREFTRFLDANKLRKIRFHGLRHTYATRALEEGVPLSVVSEVLGHANELVTASVYQHVTSDFSRQAVAVEAAILNPGTGS
jgi:integrase